jgi:sugar phosphate isomerase/epimerase
MKIAIFSKHLEFLEGEELAKGAKEIGFDGIDLAVRKGGHVEPERVRQDLPGADRDRSRARVRSADAHDRYRRRRYSLRSRCSRGR